MRRRAKRENTLTSGLNLAIAAKGGAYGLAKELGISHQSVQKWTKIPAERVHEVERITGIPRSRLRPDLYPVERERNDAQVWKPGPVPENPAPLPEIDQEDDQA